MSSMKYGSESGSHRYTARPVLMGTGVGVGVCAVLLLLFSWVVSSQSMPQSLVLPLSMLAVCLGAFAGGMFCAKAAKAKGLAFGALCGAAMSVMLLLAGLVVGDGGPGFLALFKVALVMFSSMLGGIFGVNIRRRSRQSPHRKS